MGLPQIWLHLFFVLLLSLSTNVSSAHRASLIPTTLKQARNSVPADGACCSINGKCSPCNGLNHDCCEPFGFCYTCNSKPRNGIDSGLTQGKFRELNELVTPHWVLEHQGRGWEANEPDPDWNHPVGRVGEVPKNPTATDQQVHFREAGESRACLLGQERHSRRIDGDELIYSPPPSPKQG